MRSLLKTFSSVFFGLPIHLSSGLKTEQDTLLVDLPIAFFAHVQITLTNF